MPDREPPRQSPGPDQIRLEERVIAKPLAEFFHGYLEIFYHPKHFWDDIRDQKGEKAGLPLGKSVEALNTIGELLERIFADMLEV